MGRGNGAYADKPWLANRLKVARKLRGLSQLEAAQLIGVHQNTISRYERGEFPPTTPSLYALAAAYGKNPEWFVSEEAPSADLDPDEDNGRHLAAPSTLDENYQPSNSLVKIGSEQVDLSRPLLSGAEVSAGLLLDFAIGRRPAEQEQFESWVKSLSHLHQGVRDIRNPNVNWEPLSKPLAESTVALVTTAGVHQKSDDPFDVLAPNGDSSYREIPSDVTSDDLQVNHRHYNNEDASRDVNCMFPIDRLNELRLQRVIGGVAPHFFSLMGFIPDPSTMLNGAAKEISTKLLQADVDLVLMSAGCPVCHRSMSLLQNVIEGHGIPTVAMTVEPAISAGIGSPRSVHIRFPAGNVFGEAGKPRQQRAIITAALEAAYSIQIPSMVCELPYRWHRFPLGEEPVTGLKSPGTAHPQLSALTESIEGSVRKAQAYMAYLNFRIAQDAASDAPDVGMQEAWGLQVSGVRRLIGSLDSIFLEDIRPMLNGVAILDLWASGEFV